MVTGALLVSPGCKNGTLPERIWLTYWLHGRSTRSNDPKITPRYFNCFQPVMAAIMCSTTSSGWYTPLDLLVDDWYDGVKEGALRMWVIFFSRLP